MTNAEHINNLIVAHTRRLHELEIKQATFGLNVPSEISTEIEDIQDGITKLNAQLVALTTVADLGSETGAAHKPIDRRDEGNQELRTHIMLATVQATVAEFLSLRKFVTERIDQVEGALTKQSRYGIYVIVAMFSVLALIVALIVIRG